MSPYYPVEQCNYAAVIPARYTTADSVWLKGNKLLDSQVCSGATEV